VWAFKAVVHEKAFKEESAVVGKICSVALEPEFVLDSDTTHALAFKDAGLGSCKLFEDLGVVSPSNKAPVHPFWYVDCSSHRVSIQKYAMKKLNFILFDYIEVFLE